MKISKTIFSASFVFTTLVGFHACAQNEAIPNYQDIFNGGGGGGVYSSNVVGYAIAVTALGYNWVDTSVTPVQVSLFDAGGNQLATAQITPSSIFYNQTYYQDIAPVDLTVGDTYYIQAAEPNGSGGWIWLGGVSSSFSVNPDISYLSDTTGGFGAPITTPSPAQPGYFYEDENLMFTVVPEPSVLCLGASSLLGMVGMVWYRRRR